MRHKIQATRDFVLNHKIAFTVIATATPLIALQLSAASDINEFLDKHDLLDEYYTPETEI